MIMAEWILRKRLLHQFALSRSVKVQNFFAVEEIASYLAMTVWERKARPVIASHEATTGFAQKSNLKYHF